MKTNQVSIWPYGPAVTTAARDWFDSKPGIKFRKCTADERRMIIEQYIKQSA